MSYEVVDRVILLESEPSTNPPAGIAFVYVDNNGVLSVKNSSGVVEPISEENKRYSLLVS